MTDDNDVGFLGFEIKAWALTLEVEPPPASVSTPPVAPPTVTSQRTGKRAAALAKCKKKDDEAGPQQVPAQGEGAAGLTPLSSASARAGSASRP